jgi:hypothetical protein
MIAAARRRLRTGLMAAAKRAKGAARKAGPAVKRAGGGTGAQAKRAARVAGVVAKRAAQTARLVARRAARVAGPRLRWVARKAGPRVKWAGARLFRGLALAERLLRRGAGVAWRLARRVAAALTPQRVFGALILASAAGLVVSQFVDYRAIEVGQPGYAGLTAARPPRIDAETAGQAHSYLLIAPALLAAALAAIALRRGRPRLGRPVFALGLLCLLVVLLVDRPAGLDAGAQASRFAGAQAILLDGFYAELAAAIGLILGGLLLVGAPKLAARYHARPCRIRISSFARAASALRRRPRRPASRPGRAARRASRRRSGGASAPASPR